MSVHAAVPRAATPSAFSVRGLAKSYSGVPVLKGVDLTVAPGEIHALLGANGAGKSTLIKCVSGVTTPDSGIIEVNGRQHAALTPSAASDAGIAVIYQELSVATTLSVADNVFLGHELRRGPFVRRREQRRLAGEALASLGLELDLTAPLGSYGTAEMQGVEIVKALRRNPGVLILDEPTAALTRREADQLAAQLQALRARRVPMIYVTHRLDEVFALADRVSILRAGRIVLTGPTASFTSADLVAAISGSETGTGESTSGGPVPDAPEVLSVRGLLGPDLGPLDLSVRQGEVVGLYGLVGSGRTELLETLFGARPRAAGEVRLDDAVMTAASPSAAIAAGVALVPSDRARKGIFPGLGARSNVVLPLSSRLGTGRFRHRQRENGAFGDLARRLRLQPSDPDLEAQRFSGGNQQKLVVGRWLDDRLGCRLLLLDEPTQGVDVGTRSDIYRAIRDFTDTGRGVLVASSEADELRQLAHRVIVLSRGRVAGVVEGTDISETRLLELAHRTDTTGVPA